MPLGTSTQPVVQRSAAAAQAVLAWVQQGCHGSRDINSCHD